MRKYKLLYFVSEDEYFLSHKIDQACSALKNNFEVLVVCNFTDKEKKIQSYGFKTKHIEIIRGSINPLRELFCIIKLFLIIIKFKPDLIQSVALKPILYTSIISKVFRKQKMIFCVVGLGYVFISKKISSKILKFTYVSLINIFLKKMKVLFIFQNKEDKLIFKNNKITKFAKTTIIYGSGVDTDLFKSKKTKKIYDIIFHSRILYDKGILELINAIKEIRKKKKISVLILGNPDKQNRASVKVSMLEQWQSEKLIIWKGEKKNVLPYLQKSKIAVLPSYREGLPKNLLEAASCELPIITTDVVGCKEICRNNFNGQLVPAQDYIHLSKAIEKILNNPKLSSFYGKNGRKLAIEKFSTKIIIKKFLEVYNEFLLE